MKLREIYQDKEKHLNQDISLEGWVKTTRTGKNISFISLTDGSSFKSLQVVLDQDTKMDDQVRLNISSSLRVQGRLVESQGKGQDVELKAESLKILGESDPSYPLQKKRHSAEYLRTIAHLRPRANLFQAVFRVRSLSAFAVHKFFQERGFVYAQTPLITGSDAEGAGEMFRVATLNLKDAPKKEDGSIDYSKNFFNKETHLTVSGQLWARVFVLASWNVYTFGPTFRAENPNTRRRATEFWMIEPEMAFADLDANMDVAEAMVKYIVSYVLDYTPDEMVFLNEFVDKGLLDRLYNVVDNDFERISYTEAVDPLKKSGQKFDCPVEWEIDLQTEHERYLTEKIFKRPVFVTDYPKGIRAFYMRGNDDKKTVATVDLLVPGVGEIIGESQREEHYGILKKKIEDNGFNMKDYEWYLDLRKCGTAAHSGYGLGFERAVTYVTGVSNIRDVTAFPRTVGHAKF